MPTLGLSMIVKNEASMLPLCLESARQVVSQIVIADTGSTDDTIAVARGFGATVISIPWNNNFSEARNEALGLMETDWVLVLDADEELDRTAAAALPKLLAAEAGGYLIPIRNYVPTATGRGWDRATEPNDGSHPRARTAPAYFVHENCRLFRRDPEIYFTGRVHELVEHRISALNRKLGRASFCIHHFGQLAEQSNRTEKASAYLELLRLKVQEMRSDPLAWIQLGLQEYECSRNSQEALRCFEQALLLQPRASEAWVFKGMVLLDGGHHEQALQALDHVSTSGPSKALSAHLRGDALHNLGRLEEARTAYIQAVKLTQNDPVLLSKLGYTEVRLGHAQPGLQKLIRATKAAPLLSDVRERVMKACIILNRLPEAAEQAEELARIEPNPRAFLRAASVWMHLKRKEKAGGLLEQGIKLFPADADLKHALAELA
jgi:tetratricopeptide (TPR) repeat protein